MGSDIVTVQGTPINGRWTIEFANNVSSGIFSVSSDIQGLAGMSYASTPNFIDVAFQNNEISTPVYALELNYPNQTSYLHYNNGLPLSISEKISWAPQLSNQNGAW